MKNWIVLLILMSSFGAHAAGDLTKQMDALGANQALMKKASAVDPENRVRVVQNRDVDRHYRLELGVNGALNEGGDSYVNTTSLGGNLDFHITPRWSAGVRYSNYNNSLTAEGRKAFDDAKANPQARFPDVDYAKDSFLGVINFYPVYGKMNMFDQGIAQFDVYVLGGAGRINLASGSTPLYTAGGGVGVWLSQHFTTRLEARWQGYKDQVYTGSRNINETVLGISLGVLL